jgi:hypothetical protein
MFELIEAIEIEINRIKELYKNNIINSDIDDINKNGFYNLADELVNVFKGLNDNEKRIVFYNILKETINV